MTNAVLVMAYGGPDSLDDVPAYLLDIRGGRPTSPELIAEVRSRYARIGGRSPLLAITCAQAGALEQRLNALTPAVNGAPAFRTYVGMRHWKPYIRDALAQIAADGLERGVALCMAPHASRMSTGAYLQKLREAESALDAPLELDFIESWHDQPFLVRCLGQRVRAAVERFPSSARPRIQHLFTAHSLPASLQSQGDPYAGQLQQTAGLLAAELGLANERWTFGFQSAGAAPVPWLGPSIEAILPQFAGQGIHDVLVTPIGFVADHVEVLYDLDIQAQEIAREHNIHLVRSDSLNDSGDFIAGLADLILERSASAHVPSKPGHD